MNSLFQSNTFIKTVLIGICAGSVSASMYAGNPQLSRKSATEGMVLLRNEKSALPVTKSDTIAMFGQGQVDFVKGGLGSGDVVVEYVVSILEGIANKEAEGKVKLYKPLADAYRENKALDLTQSMVEDARRSANTAIVVISRISTEGDDRTADKGDWLLTDKENDMLRLVSNGGFDKFIVVLNVASIIDTTWADEYPIDAILLAWHPGMEGGNAVSDVLCGDVNPSGKLCDTWAKSLDDYPAAGNFSKHMASMSYEEDIFVGYRYFQTFDPEYTKVRYPFGYGLSYTTFEISDVETSVSDSVVIKAKVTNTGLSAGREVVQAYYSAPNGKLGRPAMELGGFAKTKLLSAGASEVVEITFPVNQMAAYDDMGKTGNKSCYVLEAGNYKIFVGNSIKDAAGRAVKYHTIKNLVVTERLSEKLAPSKLNKRLLADGSYEQINNYTEPVMGMTEISASGYSKIDAENFSDTSNNLALEAILYTDGTTSNCVTMMHEKDRWIEYRLVVEEAGEYDFRFRMANGVEENNDSFRILLNGEQQDVKIYSPSTGDWYKFKDDVKVRLSLPKGEVFFKIVSNGPFGNIDYIVCVPVASSDELFASFDKAWSKRMAEGIKLDKSKLKPRTLVNGKVIVFDEVVSNPGLLDDFVSQFSDEEMAYMAEGHGTKIGGATGIIGSFDELNVKGFETFDGPAGVRLDVTTTAWPCATLIASSWDTNLVETIAEGIAKEATLNGVELWLAPGMNIHRFPLCGRNFEYYSEDPLISGKFAAAYVRATFANGTKVVPKHFAANNREFARRVADSRVSERALREIYLKGFEIVVKESPVVFIMSSYNLVNGIKTAESRELLTDILRSEWGFDGVVMSDWANDSIHYKEILAGNNVKMPFGNKENILQALQSGELSREQLVANTKQIIKTLVKAKK